jgi:hypothetical protein
MLNRKTTFVVGAGASCELGLPSGDQLKDDIRDVLATTTEHAFRIADKVLLEGLQQMFPRLHTDDQTTISKMAAAADRICRGLPMAQSIDNYLHTHQEDLFVRRAGMAAIARVILRAERQSCLFGAERSSVYLVRDRSDERPSLENPQLQQTWYAPLARLLFSQVPKSDPGGALGNVRFVIFNYDRCLEEFIWRATQAYFDINGDQAATILAGVEFIHPYGSLGPLPWQESAGQPSIPLGGAPGLNCFTVGESLRTFTESVHSETGAQVANAVGDAELLLLLGFGYLEQNLQLLVPEPLRSRGARSVIGTAYGIQQPSHSVVLRLLKRLATQHTEAHLLHIEPGKCSDLFRNYDMHLRF